MKEASRDLSAKSIDELIDLHISAARGNDSSELALAIEAELVKREGRGQIAEKYQTRVDVEKAGGNEWLIIALEACWLFPRR